MTSTVKTSRKHTVSQATYVYCILPTLFFFVENYNNYYIYMDCRVRENVCNSKKTVWVLFNILLYEGRSSVTHNLSTRLSYEVK